MSSSKHPFEERPTSEDRPVSYEPEPPRNMSRSSTVKSKVTFDDGTTIQTEGMQDETERDVEKALAGVDKYSSGIKQKLTKKHLLGNDTSNLYSPRMEFIATLVVILLVVSSNLSISAKPERSVDMEQIGCRLLQLLSRNTTLTISDPGFLQGCTSPVPAHGKIGNDPLVIAHSQGTKLLATSLASGLSTMVAIYIAGGLSSAHLNPIVTLAVKLVDNPPAFTWPRCVIYVLVQMLAAITAGFVGIGIHYNAISHKCGLSEQRTKKPSDECIGSALYLVPSPGLQWWGALLSDTTANTVFILIVMALRDKNNSAPEAKLGGLISGLAVTCLGLTLGLNTGGGINPVRDLGPRIAASAFGVHSWKNLWSQLGWAIWGAWGVPFLGCLLGVLIYKFIVKPIVAEKAAKASEHDHATEEKYMRKLAGYVAAAQTPSGTTQVSPGATLREADELPKQEDSYRPGFFKHMRSCSSSRTTPTIRTAI